jgi:gliding motility-associated-like protein
MKTAFTGACIPWKGRYVLLLLILSLSSFTKSAATHLRAGDILVERVCGTNSFKITVIAYLNTLSGTRFGTGSEILFGDGTLQVIPQTIATTRPDLGPNISVASYSVVHTYSSPGKYTITYIERDRSRGVLNIVRSEDVPYVSSVTIDMNQPQGCNHYPVLTVIPLDRGCSKAVFSHHSGAQDVDGDSLSYRLTIPASGANTVAAYTDPANARFYSNFSTGNEAGTGPPSFKIDSISGLITWDAPGAAGEYNIAFEVVEWRKSSDGSYKILSITVRDMQILIEECANVRPELQIPQDICVIAGAPVEGTIIGKDHENQFVKIELFSEVFDFVPERNPATYTPSPSDFVSSVPDARVNFHWQTACTHIRQQPYQVVVKITDRPEKGPPLVTFKTWNIRVIGPPPDFSEALLDVVRKEGVLNWEPYTCSNASVIQVYRKVGSFPFSGTACFTGVPGNSGYQLIGETSPLSTTYRDTNFGMGLSPGATYCYRIIARYPDTKSIVSIEQCIGPIKRDAPVITNVSVIETNAEGKIFVRWTPPHDIDKDQFPEPYSYEVYRAKDFVGDEQIRKVGVTADTTWNDDMVHTKDSVFNYRIVVYSKPVFAENFIPVDTSAAASSVRLSASSGIGYIGLHWRDSVPWSNVAIERPYHLIYRGEGIRHDGELTLYDSVRVSDYGFYYTDNVVDQNTIYTYRVVARGSYGNEQIPLLENSSQIISIYPVNNLRPCPPLISLSGLNCDEYVSQATCGQTVFENTLSWEPALNDGCRVDVTHYNIYVNNGVDTAFTLLSSVAATEFLHGNLDSPIRCYTMTAVDALGNEGPRAEPVCAESCPYFKLPNFFTPNGDGCNDLFTSRYEAGEDEHCDPNTPNGCPRFVRNLVVHIFNRWGREVFNYTSSANGSFYIDWDGRDTHGRELSTGIYYYTAQLEFETADESQRYVTLKDWVQLLR